MTIRVGNTIIATVNKNTDGGNGGGLEVGDIGFAPLGVDETQNKRRYLNGQVISQSQFESFTSWVKERAALYPSLVTSETNWQAEVTNSPYGICGKFVIDDTLGTIRLPKYPDWSIREVGEAPVIGNGMALGLYNNNGTYSLGANTAVSAASYNSSAYGTAVGTAISNTGSSTTGGAYGITQDPTKSGIIADLVNVNTEDKLQGNWFIQVATGVEETVDVTREIELNNPFSLLDYKWSEYELSNASWLLSNGTFYNGTTYLAVYELLLRIYNGTETKEGVSVKLSTEEYTDTDFIINTTDITFRLPIRVKLASSNAVIGNGIGIGITDGSSDCNITSSVDWNGSDAGGNALKPANNSFGVNVGSSASKDSYSRWGNDKIIGLTTDPEKSGLVLADNDLYLYFYIGETIQDANVINASSVLTRMAELSNEYIVGLGMPDYSSMISMAMDVVNQAPADGILICKVGDSSASSRPNFYLYFGYSSDAVDIEVARFNQTISEAWVHSTINVLIPKGMFYKFVGNDSCYIDYCPLKGVN